MATRKSTTKAKTKTRSTRSTAAKSTQVSKVNSTSSIVNVIPLRRILGISAALYLVLSVAALAIMGRNTYQITVGYLAKDELASKASTVLAPAIHVLYDVEIRWALFIILILSLATPILYLTSMERRYSDALKGRVLPWRWIDLGVIGALMIEVTALMNGIQDIVALKAVVGLVAVAAALGWLSERQNEDTSTPVWGAYVVGLVSGLLAWLMIAIYMIATPFYGMVRSPWYAYALFGALTIGFALVHINQFNQHRRVGSWKNYVNVERRYLLINVFTKVAFAAILIVGLRSQ